MPGSITVTLSGLPYGPAREGLLGPDARTMTLAAARALQAAAAGAFPSTAKVHVAYSTSDAVQASATATLSSAVATNAVTINGAAITAVASGATADQWNIGGDDTASAVNLAAAINASTTARIAGVVKATSAAAVVTITAVVPGLAGNGITLTKTGAPITVTGSGFLAGGTGADTTSTYTAAPTSL
jgi:hypothetical protein